ncbi:MAG: STT3 domain-containing protein [Candidatus Aenigmatarchaeota archaeon]|nr:dolichyl-diphosphooligosaccharide--protein glycosyltransferase subunit STT3 [Candidatus Aenigmarchaeota archaeon]
MNISKFLEKSWILILLIIFIISFWVRAVGIIPDKILSYDPVFEYRYLRYLVDFGTIPVWDELGYYVGRPSGVFGPALPQEILTIFIYNLLKFFISISLITAATYSAAFFGALIPIAAFLLVREISNNNWGALLSAALIGTAPQILIRTFGASYDTDQLVLFFILVTLWLGIRVIKFKTPSSIFLATTGFFLFATMWNMFTYTLILSFAFFIFYFIFSYIHKFGIKTINFQKIKENIFYFKNEIVSLLVLFFSLFVFLILNRTNLIELIFNILGFAFAAEKLIVNISIAELQTVSLLDVSTWILSMGRIMIGNELVDIIIFSFFISMILFSLYYLYKNKKIFEFSILFTLIVFGSYTVIRGIRFTEFTSALFLSIIGIGFSYFLIFLKDEKIYKSILIGLAIFTVLISFSIAIEMGPKLGPDTDKNWNDAWEFLKKNTNELSLVGTWWDPGHMIAGLAERRNLADGAHCGNKDCLFGINDRITDTGRIFSIENETEALNLIRKYKGTSPEVYWIASSDLIGKFQWIQYFGTGCDARKEQRCPLYLQIGLQNINNSEYGSLILNYGNIKILLKDNKLIPIYIEKRNGMLFSEIIYYENEKIKSIKDIEINSTEIGKELNIKLLNQTIPYSLYLSKKAEYIVIIPPNLRNSIFTKMFFFDGEGLTNFEKVFSNEDVKIFKVKL